MTFSFNLVSKASTIYIVLNCHQKLINVFTDKVIFKKFNNMRGNIFNWLVHHLLFI